MIDSLTYLQDFSVYSDQVSPKKPTELVFLLSQHDALLTVSPAAARMSGTAGPGFSVEMVTNISITLMYCN